MKLRSFRLRLALWSAALAGVALVSFSAAVWWHTRSDKIEAMDRQLIDQLEREVRAPKPVQHWQHFEQVLRRSFSLQNSATVAVYAHHITGFGYESQDWPKQIDINTLPWPVPKAFQNQPPPPPPPPQGFDIGNPFEPAPPPMNEPPPGPAPQTAIVHQKIAGTDWRIGMVSTPMARLGIAVDMSVLDNEMAALRNTFFVAVPLALLFIGFGAWFISGRALSPIRGLTAAMQGLTAKGLDQRIASGKTDIEFGELIQVVNSMLERLERSFMQASRFSADAAHELKTPLAIIQGQIEQTMAQVEQGSPLQARLSGILDEVQRLGTISRKLLLLSLADAGRLHLLKQRFDLSAALKDLLEDAHMLAPELKVSGNISKNLVIDADSTLVMQILHNLLSNAIKYNMPANAITTSGSYSQQGWIDIAARRNGKRIEVTVANSSPAAHKINPAKIFERFFRADSSHSRQIEGVGLGLSLAREIALAHGGDLRLFKQERDRVEFLLIFPAATAGADLP